MFPSVIKTCPSADNDFQPLSEYQEQTPETFFDGKPVLYFHDEHIKAWVSNEQAARLFFLSKESGDNDALGHPTPPESYALENNQGKHLREENRVEVFVGSNKLTLFSHMSGTGIEIPYPAITLHAIKNFHHLERPDDASSKFLGVYMQLEFSEPGAEDSDEGLDPIELTLVPYKGAPKEDAPSEGLIVDPLNAERTNALFNQISACSNLNPDPRDEEDDDEEDYDADRIIFEGSAEDGAAIDGLPGVLQGNSSGGLPPPFPGSSGWITADNVHEYFDEEGNWIGQEGVSGDLGEGAGRVRGRDEVEQGDTNGDGGVGDAESKRPRTE
ncbi:regulator of volume decrease after cellular swelling-domain-containing protein [Biscogniauxia sp. FL1348]|nr:regulator of volume decrease after cellular swelling-domain-containing protein [Biscogniauxia sp. FL1348]